MPKRPCALSFTPDERFLLSGDKFGDVYAISLYPGASPDAAFGSSVLGKRKRTDRQFVKPTATDLTVHTRKNRKALENQMKQAEKAAQLQIRRQEEGTDGGQEVQKPGEDEDEAASCPILGHVSMLLDLVAARAPAPASPSSGESRKGKYRDYIVTSDRDEHIRVSRGIPQSHIIETFCLGHTSFVNKLCIVQQNLLVSGGGDKFLCVWDWVQGRLLKKIDLELSVRDARKELQPRDIAVSGLWMLPTTNAEEDDEVITGIFRADS